MPNFVFLEELKSELAKHPVFIELQQNLLHHPKNYPDYNITPDLIMHQGRIWLPAEFKFIPLKITEFHSTPMRGHMGVMKTLVWLRDNFTWNGMWNYVQTFITACLDCQHTKYDTRRPARLLCLLSVTSRPWEYLSLDFIVGLLAYHGHTIILVVVNRFSKGIHLGMLPSQYTTHIVTTLFMNIVGKLHGMPNSLVWNCDPLFISKF